MTESVKLIRHDLGSIDLSDIDDRDMTETERREYVGAIHAVFPRIEKDIKKFLYSQLMFVSKEAASWEQVLFGRGFFDGMAMLLEHWRAANAEFESGIKKEEFEKSNHFNEI